MNEIDWIICALLLISTVVGIMRGVIREVLAIVGWIAGGLLAMRYAGEIGERIPLESMGMVPRVIIAAVLILVLSLFAVGLFGTIMRRLMEAASLSFEDRALGSVFGLVRGVIVACVCIFILSLAPTLTQSRLWQQSAMIGPAQSLIDWSMPYMPDWIQSLRGKA